MRFAAMSAQGRLEMGFGQSRLRIVFASGRELGYVRNRLIVRGLARYHSVAVVASNHPRYPRRFAAVFPRLFRAASKADLIVAGFLGQPIALVAARLLRKPVLLDAFISIYDTLCFDRRVASANGPIGRIAYALDREAVRAASLSLVDTESQRSFFAETFAEPLDRFRVHYLGPDLEACAATAVSARDDPMLVVHYSSFLPLHGVDVVVEAASRLRGDPTIRFRLVGTGPCREHAQSLATRLAATNLEFVDWLSPSALQSEIQRATIGLGGHFADNPKARRVVAGKTYQLLAAGVPTIVGDCPANREIFRPGHHAEMVPMGNPDELAKAIKGLARDGAYRRQLADAGARLMGELFDPERVASDLQQAVERTLDNWRSR